MSTVFGPVNVANLFFAMEFFLKHLVVT